MALVREIQYDNGLLVRVYDNYMEANQELAKEEAYEKAAEIHWLHTKQRMGETKGGEKT